MSAGSRGVLSIMHFPLNGFNALLSRQHYSGQIQWARGEVGLKPSSAARPHTHLSVHGTAHPMSAASVRPRSAADCVVRSAVDISHPCQQGNPPVSSSTASGPVRSDIINGLGAGTVGGWQSFAVF